MKVTSRYLAAVTIAAAVMALAPTSAASASSASCRDSGAATVCQRQGHTSLHAEPTIRTPAGGLWGSAWLPGYGRGHLPPFIALD